MDWKSFEKLKYVFQKSKSLIQPVLLGIAVKDNEYITRVRRYESQSTVLHIDTEHLGTV